MSSGHTGHLGSVLSVEADLLQGLVVLVRDVVVLGVQEGLLTRGAEAGAAGLEGIDAAARADTVVEGKDLGDHGQVHGGWGDQGSAVADGGIVALAGDTGVRGGEDGVGLVGGGCCGGGGGA